MSWGAPSVVPPRGVQPPSWAPGGGSVVAPRGKGGFGAPAQVAPPQWGAPQQPAWNSSPQQQVPQFSWLQNEPTPEPTPPPAAQQYSWLQQEPEPAAPPAPQVSEAPQYSWLQSEPAQEPVQEPVQLGAVGPSFSDILAGKTWEEPPKPAEPAPDASWNNSQGDSGWNSQSNEQSSWNSQSNEQQSWNSQSNEQQSSWNNSQSNDQSSWNNSQSNDQSSSWSSKQDDNSWNQQGQDNQWNSSDNNSDSYQDNKWKESNDSSAEVEVATTPVDAPFAFLDQPQADASGFLPQVKALADRFKLNDGITKRLDDALRGRLQTLNEDIEGLTKALEAAPSAIAIMFRLIKELQEGKSMGGSAAVDKDVENLVEKCRLDQRCQGALTQLFAKRPDARSKYLHSLEKHLDGVDRPYDKVLELVEKIENGEDIGDPPEKWGASSWKSDDSGGWGSGWKKDNDWDRRGGDRDRRDYDRDRRDYDRDRRDYDRDRRDRRDYDRDRDRGSKYDDRRDRRRDSRSRDRDRRDRDRRSRSRSRQKRGRSSPRYDDDKRSRSRQKMKRQSNFSSGDAAEAPKAEEQAPSAGTSDWTETQTAKAAPPPPPGGGDWSGAQASDPPGFGSPPGLGGPPGFGGPPAEASWNGNQNGAWADASGGDGGGTQGSWQGFDAGGQDNWQQSW
mmetsp:Transcript_10040/g.17327  ORF Transcript_10040/g.17327 Transcript_10040/m.17327 type:complete len:671 (+) Transcript_10040:24-2036(+)